MAGKSQNHNFDKGMRQDLTDKEGQKPNRFEQEEAASYIASIGVNLQKIADSAEMPFLSYLLSLVVEEARHSEQESGKKPSDPNSAA